MKALVTGGRGFAGSWLARALLASGADVTSLDRGGNDPTGLELLGIDTDVNDVSGELRDGDLVLSILRENSIDAVFHLAAQAIVGDANASPIPTFETNIPEGSAAPTVNFVPAGRFSSLKSISR